MRNPAILLPTLKSIATAYRHELVLVDEYLAREAARHPEHVHCRRGCAECCYGTFALSLADIAIVQDAFTDLPRECRHGIVERARALVAEIGIDPSLPFNSVDEADADALLEGVAHMPCPFLGDELECLIYHARPLTCRLHGLPIKGACGEVLDPGCHLNFVGVDVDSMPGYVLDIEAFDRAEEQLLEAVAAMWGEGTDPTTEVLLPAALLAPWWDGEAEKDV